MTCHNVAHVTVLVGGCIYLFSLYSRLIQHTKSLMSSDENLCIKVLKTLQEMLIRNMDFDEKVRCLGVVYNPKSIWTWLGFFSICNYSLPTTGNYLASISLNTQINKVFWFWFWWFWFMSTLHSVMGVNLSFWRGLPWERCCCKITCSTKRAWKLISLNLELEVCCS